MSNDSNASAVQPPSGVVAKFLDIIEKAGNKLPDPAMLFLIAMLIIWVCSAVLSGVDFTLIDPRTDAPIEVKNQLTGGALAAFLSNMVTTFTSFAPLGIVLVAMLGVGIAEHSGYINAGLKVILGFTPKMLLTPMLILVGIVSHTATDAGYVLVIPLGGVIYYSAGRHPLAGIAAAFAGVSGGFSANFIPSGIDPLLQGFTQSAANIIDPDVMVNPLCNYYFTSASSVLIILLGWFLTDRVVEPRLAKVPVEPSEDLPKMDKASSTEYKGFLIGTAIIIIGVGLIIGLTIPGNSPLRDPATGDWKTFGAPVMQSIVPFIFLLFVFPGVFYGFYSGAFKTSKDVIMKMSDTMASMSYYIVMAFFCSLFIYAFGNSNLGALIAVGGAEYLEALQLPSWITIIGIVFLSGFVNLLVGSASAKWALIGPIFVPMLMQLGISPDLTQAAYRVGDSCTNIVTPLMPYFPLVVVYCQKYVKETGIGTLISIMIPYSIVFLIGWSLFLLGYWALGLPLGISASYMYPPV